MMCSELKPLDSTEIKGNVSVPFCCEVSEDNFISILTDGGVLIQRLCVLREYVMPSITYSKQFIYVSDYVLSTNLEIDMDRRIGALPRFDLYECVLRSDTSASIDNCMKKQFSCIASKWSPNGTVGTQSVIAVLNDAGSLDVHTRIVDFTGSSSFVPMFNITKKGIEWYKQEWNDITYMEPIDVYSEFKRRLEIHTPVAFTWSPLIEIEGSKFCLLCVAYANGRIGFWKLNHVQVSNINDAHIFLFQDVQTNLSGISLLHWLESDEGGLLYVAHKSGVTVLPIINVLLNSMQIGESVLFEMDDEIKIDRIFSSIIDNYLFIFMVKSRFLLIHMIGAEGTILDTCTFDAGSISISGLHINKNLLLILTYTGALKELKISIVENKILIDWRHIYVNLNWSVLAAFGFFVSQNNLVYTIITNYCKLYNIKESKDTIKLSSFFNTREDPFALVLDDNIESLKNISDCLEVIRVTESQNKQICSRLPKRINYDECSLMQLKVYFYLMKYLEYASDEIDPCTENVTKTSGQMHRMIEMKLAVYYIYHILKLQDLNGTLSDFQKKSLKQLITYLREIVMQDDVLKCGFGNNFIDEVFDVIMKTKDLELTEHVTCLICGNDIIGSFCMNNHLDNRCSLSMLQLVSAQYKCPFCKRSVSSEAIKDFPVKCCPICDIELDFLVWQDGYIEPTIIANECQEDCLIDEK